MNKRERGRGCCEREERENQHIYALRRCVLCLMYVKKHVCMRFVYEKGSGEGVIWKVCVVYEEYRNICIKVIMY